METVELLSTTLLLLSDTELMKKETTTGSSETPGAKVGQNKDTSELREKSAQDVQCEIDYKPADEDLLK